MDVDLLARLGLGPGQRQQGDEEDNNNTVFYCLYPDGPVTGALWRVFFDGGRAPPTRMSRKHSCSRPE